MPVAGGQAMTSKLALVGVILALSGCADAQQAVPVQPVSIKADSFCDVMKRVLPPMGKPTWAVADTKQTITEARRVGAAVDTNCPVSKRLTQTSTKSKS